MILAHVEVIKNTNCAVEKTKNNISKLLKQILQKALNRKTVLYWLVVLTFILTKVLAKYPHETEIFYSNGLYKLIAIVLSRYSSLFPFSLDDIFLTSLILFLIAIIVALILKRKHIKTILPIFLKVIASFYIAFYWLWGFNYFRQDIYNRLNIEPSQITHEDFNAVFNKLIVETNNLRISFADFNKLAIDSIVEESYAKNAQFLNVSYPLGKRKPKNVTASKFFSASGIGGYFGPFFNEIHINKYMHPLQYPMVLAHEKAHQFGITSEAEANFYAWYICKHTNSNQIRYSANLYMLFHFLHYNKSQTNSIDAYEFISKDVADDILVIRNHWKSLRKEPIEKMNTWFNDKYLKLNNIPDGVENYGGVVKLIIDFEKQTEI